jgi:outer membrane cobalamin receptor
MVLAVAAATVQAQEVVEVPAVEVEGTFETTPVRPESSASDRVTEPSDLDAPTGPLRAATQAPSVQVRESGGVGQSAALGIRGADPQGTLATLDGIPLNSPFMGGADLSGLSLAPLESLNVLRGGYSALRGSDAVGGVLDARTPSPLLEPATRASLMVGSFGTARMKASHAGPAGPVGLLVSAGLLHSSGEYPFVDSNGVVRTREHNAARAVESLVRVEIPLDHGHLLDVLAEGFYDDRQIAGLEQFPSLTARQRDDRFLARIAWNGPPLFGTDGETTASLYVRRLGFRYRDDAPPLGPRIATSLVTWGLGLDAGVEGRVHRFVSVSAALAGTWDEGAVERLSSGPMNPSRGTIAGVVGARIGPESGAWELGTVTRLEGARGFGFRVVPRGSVSGRPLEWLRLFASVSRGFRLPTFEELHFQAGFVQGNPDLDPEDALTWDAGLAVGPGDSWEIRAAYFENRVRNLIMFLPRSAFVVRAENSGAAILRGVETSGGVKWRWLHARASYTFLDARFDSGSRMPQRPRHTVAGEAGVELGPFRAAVIPRWQSSFHLDRYESRTEEARLMLDARLELAPHPSVTLALDLHNLLDKRDAVDFLQYPLPGRAVFGTIRWVM